MRIGFMNKKLRCWPTLKVLKTGSPRCSQIVSGGSGFRTLAFLIPYFGARKYGITKRNF